MIPPDQDGQCHVLMLLLRTVPARPIATHDPLALLRSLFAGTMTIEVALSPAIQEAIAACEPGAARRLRSGVPIVNPETRYYNIYR